MAKLGGAVLCSILIVMALKIVIIPCVSAGCAAEYQESLNHTMTLKETCAEAAFRDCYQVTKEVKFVTK